MSRHPRLSPSLLRDPGHFLALGFGSGLAPVAPGTFGTLAAIPVYLLFVQFPLSTYWYAAIVLALFAIGIPLCTRTERAIGAHDHPGIVWDEVVGFLATMTAVPAGWPWIAVGFALFRLFDILKPFPINWCNRHLRGGFGIMADDLLAGVAAAAVLQGVASLWTLN
jgi:phosphatidylglycerophosphatase A